MVDSGDSHCSTQVSEPPNPNPELIDPGCLNTSVVKQPGSLFDESRDHLQRPAPVCAQRRAGGMREADAEVGRGR